MNFIHAGPPMLVTRVQNLMGRNPNPLGYHRGDPLGYQRRRLLRILSTMWQPFMQPYHGLFSVVLNSFRLCSFGYQFYIGNGPLERGYIELSFSPHPGYLVVSLVVPIPSSLYPHTIIKLVMIFSNILDSLG